MKSVIIPKISILFIKEEPFGMCQFCEDIYIFPFAKLSLENLFFIFKMGWAEGKNNYTFSYLKILNLSCTHTMCATLLVNKYRKQNRIEQYKITLAS